MKEKKKDGGVWPVQIREGGRGKDLGQADTA